MVHQLLFLVNVLPVDDSITENLDSALIVWETWVLTSNSRNRRHHVPALAHFNGEHPAPLGKLERQFNQLVALFPVHRVLAQYFVQVVKYSCDAVALIVIL